MRQEGYYWVLVNESWKVMEWKSDCWWEFGTSEELTDECFDKIDEQVIVK